MIGVCLVIPRQEKGASLIRFDIAELALVFSGMLKSNNRTKYWVALWNINKTKTLYCFTFSGIKVLASNNRRSLPIVDGIKITTRLQT